MHQLTHDLPVTMEAPGTKMSDANWGGMAVGYRELPAGTDFTPLLEGLPDDACQCPHWGYVIKGAVHVRYTDGTEEVNSRYVSSPVRQIWFEFREHPICLTRLGAHRRQHSPPRGGVKRTLRCGPA
jgi:hypothetical protein